MSMISYSRKKLTQLLKVDFIRFCIVGGLGFVINLTILTLLHGVLEWPLFLAQLIGSEVALFSNFLLHHHWTYKSHNTRKSVLKLVVQFHAVSWPAIIGSTLMVSFTVSVFHVADIAALAISSAVAIVWNFIWSKYVVWRDVHPEDISDFTK